MAESRYPSSRSPSGWSQHPADRGRQQRREQRREHAARLLSCYLRHVGSALRAEGFTISDARIGPGPDLEARLRVHRGEPHDFPFDGLLDSPVDSPFELFWAEDTGWRVEHHLLGGPTQAAPWRYLHLELVPAPSAVARFAAAVLTEFDDVGMPYPAQFRFRSQPLQPVIDALARHSTPPDSATDAVLDATVGEVTDGVVGTAPAAPVTE